MPSATATAAEPGLTVTAALGRTPAEALVAAAVAASGDEHALEDPAAEPPLAGAAAPLTSVEGQAAARADALTPQISSTAAATVQHLASEIARRLEARSTRFELELHPADLGRVDVRLDVGADGRVQAQLSFDNPAAAADLRARADELRRQLEQAGFQLAREDLSFSDRGGRGFADGREGQGGAGRARAFRGGAELTQAADTAPRRGLSRSALDVRI